MGAGRRVGGAADASGGSDMDEALLFGDASMEPLEDDGADLGGGMALVGSASVVEVGGSGSGSGAGTASTLSSSQASVVQSQPADPMRQTFVDALSTLKSIAQASKGGVASCVGSLFSHTVCACFASYCAPQLCEGSGTDSGRCECTAFAGRAGAGHSVQLCSAPNAGTVQCCAAPLPPLPDSPCHAT